MGADKRVKSLIYRSPSFLAEQSETMKSQQRELNQFTSVALENSTFLDLGHGNDGSG